MYFLAFTVAVVVCFVPSSLADQRKEARDFSRPFPCNKSLGNFPDPERKCSDIFYTCSIDAPHGWLFSCPPGLFYDQQLNLCAFFFQVPECTGIPRPTPNPNATTPKPGRTIPCADNKMGNFRDPDEKCSRFFFICGADFVGREFICPVDLFYDPEVNQCLHRDEIPVCTGNQRKPTNTTGIPRPPVAFDCTVVPDGNYVIANQPCPGMFVQCSGGQPFPVICPANLRYSLAMGKCLHENEVPGCPNFVPPAGGVPTMLPPAMTTNQRGPQDDLSLSMTTLSTSNRNENATIHDMTSVRIGEITTAPEANLTTLSTPRAMP